MSIQWTIVASFLYFEIAVVLLLALPVATAKRWQKIFKSRFLAVLGRRTSLYFYVLLFVLVLFLLDAVREIRKYSQLSTVEKTKGYPNLGPEMQISMKLFRAQRNFYISGFALFLSLVIRRLCSLISSLAHMEAQSEAAMKQAASATSTARDLLAQGGMAAENSSNEAHDKEVKSLLSEISKLKKELEAERVDKETIKKQAESTNKEYDRLNEEYNKLQRKLLHDGDKKDD
ncbi:hypothetical protein RUM43_001416 [Polyplax serrata]|uniref:Endoplasmic reticulum transmembrane protein n=1 Tax=Polyplax serrata TaxID=468196 RepID=A0AAN8SJG2_POLSC